jgi:hypothetical protein
VQVLAISPRCPVLLRQLKAIERDHESVEGAWLKDDGQHGADALLAGVAMTAVRLRATAKPASCITQRQRDGSRCGEVKPHGEFQCPR